MMDRVEELRKQWDAQETDLGFVDWLVYKKIMGLEADRGQAMAYMASLLKSVYPSIHPLDDLMGLVSQIDNGLAVPRSDAVRLAALVLEYVTPDGIRPTAPREKLADMVSLARTLAREQGRIEPGDYLTGAKISYIVETGMPSAPGVYEDTGADPVHPHFTPQAEQRRDGGG